MLDRNLIRQNPELVRLGASHKRVDAPIDEFLAVDGELRTLKLEVEEKRAESNRISKTIGQLMAQGKKEEAETAKIQAKAMSDAVSEQEPRERELEARLRELEFEMPNLAQDSVPVGYSEAENVHVRESGEKLKYDFEPKAHWDIAESLGLLDFERAAKISGSGFALYTGWGARLQRALFNFMIDHQSMNNGYREIYPPYVVNRESLMATGQLPKFEEDLFKVGPDHFLIPTAEVPVTNLYRDEILNPEDLTLKMAAFSGCFRREAGAAGKDTRGIQRMHQFDKVELVKMCKPEDSSLELESLVADAEQILQILGLHYRVALLCTGEMSFSNAKCYDLEVWCPGVGRYLEVSSCSNFLDFQARRAGIRFRREAGAKPEFVHILNGSGVATPRLFAAIVETFQQPDGSVIIPTALRPYVGTDRISAN